MMPFTVSLAFCGTAAMAFALQEKVFFKPKFSVKDGGRWRTKQHVTYVRSHMGLFGAKKAIKGLHAQHKARQACRLTISHWGLEKFTSHEDLSIVADSFSVLECSHVRLGTTIAMRKAPHSASAHGRPNSANLFGTNLAIIPAQHSPGAIVVTQRPVRKHHPEEH